MTDPSRSSAVKPKANRRDEKKPTDEALHAIEREAKQVRRGRAESAAAQRRIVAIFPRFASTALGLEDEAVRLLTDGFLPIGTQFAQWARRFDPRLSLTDTTQACRNAWTFAAFSRCSATECK